MEMRKRVVTAYEDGEGTLRELGERFGIGEATVNRWVSQSRHRGTLEPKRQGRPPGPVAVSEAGDRFIEGVLQDIPDTTAPEMVAAYAEEFGVTLSASTVKRAFSRLGYTRKRGSSGRRQPNGRTSWRREKSS
jgi:transposase